MIYVLGIPEQYKEKVLTSHFTLSCRWNKICTSFLGKGKTTNKPFQNRATCSATLWLFLTWFLWNEPVSAHPQRGEGIIELLQCLSCWQQTRSSWEHAVLSWNDLCETAEMCPFWTRLGERMEGGFLCNSSICCTKSTSSACFGCWKGKIKLEQERKKKMHPFTAIAWECAKWSLLLRILSVQRMHML